jgi:dihydroorotate dehydrogenase
MTKATQRKGGIQVPDWSYQTLFRPLLFRLPARVARGFTLGAMGAMSRLPGGTFVIRTLGHMELSPLLESRRLGVPLRYPIGLSGGVDPQGIAQKALSPFGFGYFEVGPITVDGLERKGTVRLERESEAILYQDRYGNDGLERISERLRQKQGHTVPLMLRLRHGPDRTPAEALGEYVRMMEVTAPFASGFFLDSIDERWTIAETVALLEEVADIALLHRKPMLLYVPLGMPLEKLEPIVSGGKHGCWTGYVIGDTLYGPEGDVAGKDGKVPGLIKVEALRQWVGSEPIIITGAGIHEPQDALEALSHGADYVQLHSGLIYSGPGLPKRINEAILYQRVMESEEEAAAKPLSFWHSWGWMCLLGIGMVIGGILAWWIAATSILLPYDEAFLGMTRQEIGQVSERLLHFMSHDRITLAGTMISIGILYFFLGRFGLREQQHWAKTALMASGTVGFSSFFLFLGYGYLDQLHALAAAVLLPMFILAMRGPAERPPREKPNLHNDALWRRAQWGQLMLVALGFALSIGGMTISLIGITNVFVPEDLMYLQLTPGMLDAVNPRLIPLIAHDRAGFGGALLSDGIALAAAALWGISQGRRWLWWMLLLGGIPGFAAGFGVHGAIGYMDVWHLLPPAIAVLLYAAGLILLYPYMAKKG